ncbi:MAG: transporter permease [Mucilaginibacter sp.]|nr:transporter permease [Mucilaginibacter sp.]
MLKNYLKITWRNLRRHKAFSLINISGLAIGMASSALILLWIQNEVSYDQFHAKKDRLYSVYNRSVFDGKLWCWNTTPKVMAKTLKQDYPQIEEVARTSNNNFLFTINDKHLNVPGYFTDPGFLTMFSFPLVSGNKNTALNNIKDIVITQKLAKKLFGNDNAMGKTIKIDSNAYFTVSAVMQDLPNNTQFKFEYLMPWSYLKKIGGDDTGWGNNSIQTWALLKPGVTEAEANKSIVNITRSHSEIKDIDVFVHPSGKWRLYSKFDQKGKISGGRIETIRIFSMIAAFILIIACINFMNLSTARSEKRAREVGIRKVVGALRGSLISQFLGESIFIALIAGLIAIVIVQLSLSGFNRLTDKQLYIPYSSPWFWFTALSFILFTGLISGSYPALYLSSFRPVSVLKGTFKAVNALITPRKLLVVVQFTFAVVLIVCTIIIRQQLQYAQDRETGYKKDNLVYVMMTGNVEKQYALIKNDLLASGAAAAVSKTSAPITQGWSDSWDFIWDGKDMSKKIDFNMFNTDGDLVKTMGLKLIAGRDIDVKTYPTDSVAMILNETAVKTMGFKNPVGQIIKRPNDATHFTNWHVIGVVKDFILQSPYEPVKAMIIQGPKSWFNVIHFKLNGAHTTAENLKLAEKVFKKYNPDYPFEYNFIDQDYAKKFGDEQRIGTLASLFAGLTIIISCLGLFGLAAYMAQNRIKEIGVRKVLGASVAGVTTLLSKDFLKLVMIAFAIAMPIAWWAMYKWLQGYSYRISISIWVFVLAALITIIISLITVSFQAIKAALANPVKSLRSE